MFFEVDRMNDDFINSFIAIGIFLLFIMFRKVFTKYIYKLILRLTKKSQTDFFTYVWMAFEHPIRWFFIIIGLYLSLKYLPFFPEENFQANSLFGKFIQASFIILITWGLYNLSSTSSLMFHRLNSKLNVEIDEILIPFLSKTIRFIVIAIGISVVAQVFDYDVNGFVAGLGLGGLAVALAAQDALSNLFGGVVIITEKPFSIGDWIETPSVEGTVEDISFRSTTVRTFAQAIVIVPNATLTKESITNWSKMGKRRITFQLGVAQDTPIDKLKNVVKKTNDFLHLHEDIHQETIFVTFDSFSTSSLDLFFYFFTKTTNWEEYLQIKQEVNMKILEVLEEEDVLLAHPVRKLLVNQDENTVTLPIKEKE